MARRRIKKTYKQQQREIEETPEYVEEQLWSMSDWMEENWRPVVAVLGAVTLLWGGAGLYQTFSASSGESAAAASAPVFVAANQTVYAPPADQQGEDPNKPFGPSYASEAERSAAVIATEGSADTPATALIVGAAKGRKGDWAGQLKTVDAALAAYGDNAVATALHGQRAAALTGLGKHAEAAKAWATVAAATSTKVGKGLAQVRIGDLHNAGAGGKAADAGKAKAAYAAAMKVLAVDGKAPTSGAAAFLYADARIKSAQL
ncbi:MAG: hypothetical protein KC502_04060 [Myxococcales bacterium]|nr:hypothetical protein [Myxococcales bacterium]